MFYYLLHIRINRYIRSMSFICSIRIFVSICSISCIQELKGKVGTLEGDNAELKGKVVMLEAELVQSKLKLAQIDVLADRINSCSAAIDSLASRPSTPAPSVAAASDASIAALTQAAEALTSASQSVSSKQQQCTLRLTNVCCDSQSVVKSWMTAALGCSIEQLHDNIVKMQPGPQNREWYVRMKTHGLAQEMLDAWSAK